MGNSKRPIAKGCAILAAVIIGIPLLTVGVVGVKTWLPLQEAGEALNELDRVLGPEATYTPAPSGEIPAERMELFLELRTRLVTACGEYGTVQRGFEAVDSLDENDPGDLEDVGGVAYGLGGAALSITPFLAEFFALRNDALLAASMGLQEYSYIYATAYREHLLSPRTRNEIFCDGDALSPEASALLQGCLSRQIAAALGTGLEVLSAELARMEADPSRLIWQDGLPEALGDGILPYRERLDQRFCGATAGLEMERDSGRALRLALE